MKNRKSKKILLVIIFSILLILVIAYSIMKIYAVFHSEVFANAKLEKGIWNIFINNEQVKKGTDTVFIIDKINTTQNPNVKPGNIAPGLTGSFEIEINPTNTDVAIRYDITLNQEELKNSSLRIKSIYEGEEQENSLTQTDENTFTGIIPLEEIKVGKKKLVKIEVEWTDDRANDKEDTILGSDENAELQIPVNIHICQYLGEEIIQYHDENP